MIMIQVLIRNRRVAVNGRLCSNCLSKPPFGHRLLASYYSYLIYLFSGKMSAIGPEIPSHFLTRSNGGSPSDGGDHPSAVGPQIPPHLVAGPSKPLSEDEANKEESDSDDDYAPALPPDFAARSGSGPTTKVVGPTFPQPYSKSQNHDRSRYGIDADEEDSDDDVGPMPLPDGISFEEENGVREFMEREERRRKQVEVRVFYSLDYFVLCISYPMLSITQEAAKPKALKRDEWMLVPPSSSDLLGCACAVL